jgi:hypothetical protein
MGVGAAQPRPRFAPKVPVAWIVQVYRRDALGIQDPELLDKVGGRLYTRCLDVLAVSASFVRCPLVPRTPARPKIRGVGAPD